MAYLKKQIIKYPVLFITLLYLLFRLPYLTLLPIFIDEATYLDWGWRTIHLAGSFFYPLIWSKMPLLMWLFGIFQSVIPDPLLAGRLVSVITGWLGLVGIYKLAKTFFHLHISLLASLLYILLPIFVFYDRQALMESALSATGIWSCYFLYKFLTYPHFKWSILLGFVLGLAFLTKANGLIFIVSTVLIVLFSVLINTTRRITYLIQLICLMSSFLITASIVLFQDFYWKFAGSITFFTLTPAELIKFPVTIWLKNLWIQLDISFWYLTPLIFISAFLGWQRKNLISTWIILTVSLTTLTVRHTETRYLAPYLAPLLIFSAHWLSGKIKLFPVFILPAVIISGLLIYNPPVYFNVLSHLTTQSQIENYLTGRNTGYQVQATLKFIDDHLLTTPGYFAGASNAGNPEQAMFTYLRHRPNALIGYLDDNVIPVKDFTFSCMTASVPVYFIARHNEQGGLQNYYQLVSHVTNSYNADYNDIYTFKTPCTGPTANIDKLILMYKSSL